MQNIYEILKTFGVEIPTEKKAEFDKSILDNYKTISEVEKLSGKLTKASEDLTTSKQTISTLTNELQGLKDSNASAEEWKKKFEDLQTDISIKEKEEKEQKEKAEKEANILNRYNSVCVDKEGKPLEWSHDAIKENYYKKFTEALADDTNTGKSDSDIFNALTKDDAVAFKIPQPVVNLKGGSTLGGPEDEIAAAKAVMGLK